MNLTNLYDHPMYQSFVSPQNCKQLLSVGINTETPYMWRYLPDGNVRLFTLAFDEDDYYKAGERMIKLFNPIQIPAFQGKDVEKLLPDYYMEKQGQLYRLLCSAWFPDKVIQDQRLPDAFARLAYVGLLQHKISPFHASEIINCTA